MRLLCTFLMVGSIVGAAQASSFVIIAPEKQTVSVSMVALGAPNTDTASSVVAVPAQSVAAISASMVALGDPAPGIAYENVAAIGAEPAKPKPHREGALVVIRGGEVGNAFSQAAPAAVAAAPAAATQAPEAPKQASAKAPEQPRASPPAPQPQPVSAPAPEAAARPTTRLE